MAEDIFAFFRVSVKNGWSVKDYSKGFIDRKLEKPELCFFKVYCYRRKAPAARIFYNRLRQLPEKEANRFLRCKLRSMRASLPPKAWGGLSGSHAYAHCVIAIPRLAAGGTGRVFPAADVAGFTTPRGSAALSWLTLYMGDCRHILTTIILHWPSVNPIFGSGAYII